MPTPLEGTREYQHLPLLSRSLRIKSIKIIFKLFLDSGYFEIDGTHTSFVQFTFSMIIKMGRGGHIPWEAGGRG